ncbi:dihydrolipoyl dehydrogenase [Radiobacillus kanasensis]|uniref:dihydrolipoyl dehydrogenase n=1 Tax=Radiobacillus kanasensis TaxID=2844358 RepID=UPI001E491815|nr:dihydrolipoyl dehydrogenase [Radiobacillus kanasensis]UFT98606.1 dihydrolipoyl dehydrogenase [Radiobacillus kanasensis]
MKQYDVAIIGGGPGGYVAAIRAAKHGKKVALIEGKDLGGTCLNRGCIPSKTLLHQAFLIEELEKSLDWGIEANNYSINFSKLMKKKDGVITQLKDGIGMLLKKNKVDVIQGYGFVQPDKIIQIQREGQQEIKATSIILANGSTPIVPPIEGVGHPVIHTSDSIFHLERVPERLVIIGGGVIGVEIACIFHSLGTKVDIIEMGARLIPNEDEDASGYLRKELEAKGITVRLNSKVLSFQSRENDRVEVYFSDKDSTSQSLPSDCVLLATGRKPNYHGLETLELQSDGPFVKVDDYLETNLPGIYAIGDLIGGFQLAHAASHEGLIAVGNILGKKQSRNDFTIPRCVYTFPEIAAVGLTEEQAIQKGYLVKVQKVSLASNPRAMAMNSNTGFIKLVAEEKYGELLGVTIAGPHATEMISQPSSYMHLEGTVEELAHMVSPHPTLSEGLFEVANSFLGKGIHY